MNPVCLIVALTLALSIPSCIQRSPTPPYAIRDFKENLQPWLTRAINTGIVGFDTATQFITYHATDSDINILSMSENPILRAIALQAMTHRPGFNHPKVMMAHLDDTAIIFEDVGEWGIRPVSVTDYMIYKGRWKTKASRDTLANEILLHHDNLRSAYTAVPFLPERPEYHEHIKKMALRNRVYESEIENALYALAKYKRRDDIPLIKKVLLENESRFSGDSFGLMIEYPDTAYLEVVEQYYPRRFYHAICRDQHLDIALSYIRTLAAYKADTCAKLLSDIFNRKPLTPCAADTLSIKWEVMYDIWNNPCRAFAGLRPKVASEVLRRLRRDSLDRLRMDRSYYPIIATDTFPQPAEAVRWW